MKTRIAFGILFAIASLAACKREAQSATTPGTGDYAVRPWQLFAGPGSMAPDLVATADGRLLLSWLSKIEGRRNALQFASYTDAGGWQSQPRTIAVGHSLVANWADTPHLLVTPDGAMWAQWLQANASAPSAYDVALARSRDGGMTWPQITRINQESAGTYSGFVALWPAAADRLGIAWLDGSGKAAGDHGGHGEGDMQLRANAYDKDLTAGTASTLDLRSCDCCQTDAAMTARGPILVWRGRSEAEIRDIMVARLDSAGWTAPRPVHADNWKIAGCPVNGPAIAAAGEQAVVAWYSEGDGAPAVRIARSSDAGDSFAAPVVVARGKDVLGRVDAAIDGDQAWVAWLREDERQQTLMLARYSADLGKELQRLEVAPLQGRGRATGFPKLVVQSGVAWLVWTDVIDGVAQLKGARVTR